MQNVRPYRAWDRHRPEGHFDRHPTANTVTISVVSAAGTKNVTIQATDKTQLMHYASDSVKFADARPSPLVSIQAGDQLTARGDKSPDGLTMIADEIVTGSFRNISGQIVKIDLPGNALTVKDLTTKATVTVALTSNTDMRMLPEAVATRFAARLKGGAGAGAGQGGGQNDGGRSASSRFDADDRQHASFDDCSTEARRCVHDCRDYISQGELSNRNFAA